MTNVFGGKMEEILPCWIGRESAARAVGRGNVRFHQKSMDSCRENWRLCSIGWWEVMRGVWVANSIRRPRGDGGRPIGSRSLSLVPGAAHSKSACVAKTPQVSDVGPPR